MRKLLIYLFVASPIFAMALPFLGTESGGAPAPAPAAEVKFSTRVTASFGKSDVAVIYDLTTPSGWSLDECRVALKGKVDAYSYPGIKVRKAECVALVPHPVTEKPALAVKKDGKVVAAPKNAPKLAPTPVPLPTPEKAKEPITKGAGYYFSCVLAFKCPE